MDFWARLLGGNYSPKKPPLKAVANDPSARSGRFRRVYETILHLCNQPRNLDAEGPLLDKLHAHVERLVVLIREETRAPIPHVCIQYAASRQIYAVIARAASVSQYEPMIKAAVAVFAALIDSEEEGFLSSGPFAKSLMRLITRAIDNGTTSIGLDTETAILEVLFTVAAKIRLEPEILPVWFQARSRPPLTESQIYEKEKEKEKNSFAGVTQKDDFPLCYLLIDRVHHEGRIGDFARTGLLYIFEATGRSANLEEWVISSDLPTLMASGLGALYSQLSRELSIIHPDVTLPAVLAMSDYNTTHPRATAESAFSDRHRSHMSTFLSYLAFWQDVLDHCRSSEVNQTLLDHFQILFLQQLLYPSLLQSSDTDAGSSIAVLTYMTTMLEALEYPKLIHMILIYLLNIDDKMTSTSGQNTPSASINLSQSTGSLNRRGSIMLLSAIKSPEVEPTLFSLVDLILNSIGSRNNQTVYAALKLTSTLIVRQKKYALGTLIKVRRVTAQHAARSVGALHVEISKFSELLNEHSHLDDDFQGLCEDVGGLIEAQAPIESEKPTTSGNQDEPQPCQNVLPVNDQLMRALTGLLLRFFTNSIDVNLALTQAVISIFSCVDIRLDGWLALDPSNYSHASDAPTAANRWHLYLDEEEKTAWSSLQHANRHPMWSDQNKPKLYNTVRALMRDLDKMRLIIPNLDQLLAGRKAMLHGVGVEAPQANDPPSRAATPVPQSSGEHSRRSSIPTLTSQNGKAIDMPASLPRSVTASPSPSRPAESESTLSVPSRPIFQPPPPETPSTTDLLMRQISFPSVTATSGHDDEMPSNDVRSASLNHILTNIVLLQQFVQEILAVLQVRAAVLGEKEYFWYILSVLADAPLAEAGDGIIQAINTDAEKSIACTILTTRRSISRDAVPETAQVTSNMNTSKPITSILRTVARATRRTDPRTRFLALQPSAQIHNAASRPAQNAPASSSPASSNPQLAFPCLDNVEERTQKLRRRSMLGPEPSYTSGIHKTFHSAEPILLDWGGVLTSFDIAYETWGTLNADKSNAILLHTGLSASSHAHSTEANPKPGWWERFIGPGAPLDTDKYFIICTNVLGGCYGSTGPSSIDPVSKQYYGTSFPILTLQDMVRAQFRLLDSMGIDRLYASVGCSMGGMQSLAAGIMHSERVGRIVSVSGCARSHPYSIAMRHTQRQVLMNDPAWAKTRGNYYTSMPPHSGMKLARQIATVTYRSGPEWENRFGRQRADASKPPALCPDFLIETYLDHAGEKWCLEYDANSLLYVSKAMDLFDLGKTLQDETAQRRRKNAPKTEDAGSQHESQDVCYLTIPDVPYQETESSAEIMESTGQGSTSNVQRLAEDLIQGLAPLRNTPTLVLGVASDILFPAFQQREIADTLRKVGNHSVTHVELGEDRSLFGHDTFLLDLEGVGGEIKRFLAHFTTASSQKKRKLAPFARQAPQSSTESSYAHFDHEGLAAQADSSPSGSPQPLANTSSARNSPEPRPIAQTTRTSPPLFLPPHLQEEVLHSRESSSQSGPVGAPSPSSAFAKINIDCGSSVDMSGSEYGANGNDQAAGSSPSHVMSTRSASPAKRSASHMEDRSQQELNDGRQSIQGSFDTVPDNEPSDFDEAMTGMSDTQETVLNSLSTSMQGTMSANTSSTSIQSDLGSAAPRKLPEYTVQEIDEQVGRVMQAMNAPLHGGQKGVVVAKAWLARVVSRTSEHIQSNEFKKEDREGPIGPIDNSSIVPEDGFRGPFLHDKEGKEFIPLKAGLTIGIDFEMIPSTVWGEVVAAYGIKQGQHQISRYVTDSATSGSQLSNYLYDIYPPTFTVRKVSQPNQEGEKSTPSFETMRGRGQTSPDDAIQLVTSRSEKFQHFLKRSKAAAGIPLTTKVKVWSIPTSTITASGQLGVLSPLQSQSAPPPVNTTSQAKLVVSAHEFQNLELGKDKEIIEVQDETNNPNYNGKSTMDTFGLFDNRTLILEEQVGGHESGEIAFGQKEKNINLSGLKNGPTVASTTTSGRTSPAPGGMTTRGRTQRNGRTRGTVGLTNLGNTCYMNSALQCIRSVEELAVYFLCEKYKAEINASNPLGHGGHMAKSYAGVLKGIYESSTGGAFTPRQFKSTLGSIQPLFAGYGQQDSQEFLSFLVDALHEDLNRVLKKPYNENPDSDDSTVHDPQAIIALGNTYRENHKARNDSIAMDLFNGFYKNTMECPTCKRISITFDPFSLVTLQLPIESTFQHTITFVPLYGSPINHVLDIDKNGSFKTLKESVAGKYSGVSADRLWLAEIYNHKVYKVYDNSMTLAEANIQTNDHIFLFEVSNVPTNQPQISRRKHYSYGKSLDETVESMDHSKADCFAVPIFSRKKSKYGNGWDMTMHPLYISVTREEAKDYDTILKKVLIAVSNMTTRPILIENDENQGVANNHDLATGEDDDKDGSSVDGGAKVSPSDHSIPSEDGYVEVSVNGASAPTEMVDAPEDSATFEPHKIPARFMEQDYFISPALRNQLFTLNYAQSSDGAYCASMASVANRVSNMYDRVQHETRRGSIDSSASNDSNTSTGSTKGVDETEESDADDDEKLNGLPKVTSGYENSLSYPAGDDDEQTNADSEDSPESPHDSNHAGRHARGKPNKFGRARKEKKKKGKKAKDRNNNRNHRPGNKAPIRSVASPQSMTSPQSAQYDDDEEYYIKLGEGIVLDWYPEAIDALFGGSATDTDELRGSWTSSEDGRLNRVFPDPVLDAKRQRRADRKKNGITLEDCFAETGKREILSEDNAWYCNRCKEMRQAAKTLDIWTIPDILIVHLKRFGGNRAFRDKIDVLVDYPIQGLDMTEKVGLKEDGKEYLYDLFAVDNHFGGLGGGHYTAMAKNFYDGQWYDYNDSMCSKIGDAPRHSAAAYLLFYRRRSEKPLGPGSLQKIVMDARRGQFDGAEIAEDSGEVRLGDRTSSLNGSPSVSTAEVEAGVLSLINNSRRGDGAGAGADHNPTRNSMTMNPTSLQANSTSNITEYGNQGTTWSFNSINPASPDDEDDEIASVTAADSTYGEACDSAGMADLSDDNNDFSSTTGCTSPVYQSAPFYSHDDDINASDRDEDGLMGIDEDNVRPPITRDPPAVEIHVPDAEVSDGSE
ncbi:Hypothetical protein R9X50_00590000 [Acrodontium crateriforme]|uniref:AB hydrolase-1 domain-containing protein n=1 Tax=Acrodontium crateriforme TaxID=150365 RepID=A0AAQ3MAP6_9PEZI|nr:Hypothetical protein R9X50_00590000 [Acrodontium crateriforme]